MCGTDDGTRRPSTMRARGTSATTTTTTRTSIDRSRRWRRCGALRASTRDDDGRDAAARERDAEAFEEMVVLHESEAVVIVNKPRGMSFHSEFAPGALARLRTQMGETTTAMSVHRLDKPTSGILVFAKNARARDALSKAFEEKEIVKYYVGMSNRKASEKDGHGARRHDALEKKGLDADVDDGIAGGDKVREFWRARGGRSSVENVCVQTDDGKDASASRGGKIFG